MKEAGEEERQLAIERGGYHQGVPAITVILDGVGPNDLMGTPWALL